MPAATEIRAQAIFPAGTLLALQTGLRTKAAIAPADLSVTDLQRLTITLNGTVVPADQVVFQAPTTDDSGQIIIAFTISGRAPSPDDRLTLSLPSRKLILIATTGTAVLTVASTAKALLADVLAALGQPDLPVPQEAMDRIAARLASALVASTPDDPTATRAMRFALDTLAKAIASGAATVDLRTLDLE